MSSYGVWDRPDDIPFESLPERYAPKVSSASHANCFAPDLAALILSRHASSWRNGSPRIKFHGSRERAYKDCKPRIVCEKFLGEGTGDSPVDYRFYCFDGEPAFI